MKKTFFHFYWVFRKKFKSLICRQKGGLNEYNR